MEPGNTEHYLEQLNLTELMEQLNRCFSSAFLADFSLEQLFSDILSGNGKEALQLLGRQSVAWDRSFPGCGRFYRFYCCSASCRCWSPA
ncbi:hypothetical protein [Gallintestinimicrobium sp.]|uniref:hypothetical protein n=1 Tax=Gallintestinimicrobium sp. TaxID=2981655 RepID=UPI003994D1B9